MWSCTSAMCAAIGRIDMTWLVLRVLVNRVAPKTLLSPVLVVLAVPILGEPRTANVLIGGAIISPASR